MEKSGLQHKIILDVIERSLEWSQASSWGRIGDGPAEMVGQLSLEKGCSGSAWEEHVR